MANSGQFQKNHKKIEGSGIKKGQKHRSTEMVNSLFDFFESEKVSKDLSLAWNNLNEKEKWDVFIKCLKFMAPTISSITFEDNKLVSSAQQLIANMVAYKKKD